MGCAADCIVYPFKIHSLAAHPRFDSWAFKGLFEGCRR